MKGTLTAKQVILYTLVFGVIAYRFGIRYGEIPYKILRGLNIQTIKLIITLLVIFSWLFGAWLLEKIIEKKQGA